VLGGEVLNEAAGLGGVGVGSAGPHDPFAGVGGPGSAVGGEPRAVDLRAELGFESLDGSAGVGGFGAGFLGAGGEEDGEGLFLDAGREAGERGLDGAAEGGGEDLVDGVVVGKGLREALALRDAARGEVWVVVFLFVFGGEVVVALSVLDAG
jgi:hypothetical protein